MADKTIIAWTDHTFNVAWGCTKISPGCKNCYADTLSRRYGQAVWGPTNSRRTFGEKHWREPLAWAEQAKRDGRPHRVFTSSMCDVFEDHATIAAERERLWPLIRRTSPWLRWQILTKRADGLAANLPADWPLENVWLGVSIESQEYAWRADELRALPAVVRFISYEPALGPLRLDLRGIDWLIFGGESGPGYRPMDPQWARDIRDACRAAGVAFFYKQSAAYRTEMGTVLDGQSVKEYPRERTQAQAAAPAQAAEPTAATEPAA